ncbi:MAG: endonuclease/exonuclease/phosphatase family protein [Candidatus Saccharimonadales bacterium]
MKIIYLNTWGGKQERELRKFLQKHAKNTDIFCFQESEDAFRRIAYDYLVDFTEYYVYSRDDIEENQEDYAVSTFIKKGLSVYSTQIVGSNQLPRGAGIVSSVDTKRGGLHVLNYHGVSRPKNKLDTEDRLKEVANLQAHFDKLTGMKILGGDFNFLPNTDSYRALQSIESKELIGEYRIPTTRNRLYWDNREEKHLYSDYIFISSEIPIKSFEVPDIEVSDHLPLILNLDLS